ncbi:hypothetical protein ACQW5G_00680 [Fructilactobacillus sp. Tb1]|uniref:hypothetical protein n=1 Tax=Fructilactobacillus sp. Tb1 TaxID=3422304 RepID=UPI003D2BF6FF
MNEYDNLTNEAKYTLITLYRNYLSKEKQLNDRFQARQIDSLKTISNILKDKYSENDVIDIIRELSSDSTSFINASWSSNYPSRMELNTKSISVMQNKFKNNASNILDTLIKLKSLIF